MLIGIGHCIGSERATHPANPVKHFYSTIKTQASPRSISQSCLLRLPIPAIAMKLFVCGTISSAFISWSVSVLK